MKSALSNLTGLDFGLFGKEGQESESTRFSTRAWDSQTTRNCPE